MYANLFKYNFVELVQKEVTLKPLLESSIFNLNYETQEWPATSVNTKLVRAPYNQSIFKLREMYHSIFPDVYKKELERFTKRQT